MDDKSCALIRNSLSLAELRELKLETPFRPAWESVKREVPQGSVLGPMLFNIFINDLFFHVKKAKLNAYADDHQVYYSHVDPAALEACVSHDVGVANQWYHENGMIVNESKHQCLILGDTEYGFSFPVKDTLEIFGMEIDNKLNFFLNIYQMYAKRLLINLMLCCAFENSYVGKSYSIFTKRIFYLILIIAPLPGTFVERAMRISLKL